MKHLSILVFIGITLQLLLSSCASHYKMSTNLDQENFSAYFSPASVKVYDSESAFNNSYKNLGSVEGEACQEKAHHEHPNEIDARTNARKKAFELGANGIIFSGCVLIEQNKADKKCLRSTVCYGRAFFLQNNDKQ